MSRPVASPQMQQLADEVRHLTKLIPREEKPETTREQLAAISTARLHGIKELRQRVARIERQVATLELKLGKRPL